MLLTTTALAAGTRHSGTVVDVGRDNLVVDKLGRAGKEQKLHLTVTANTRVVESERNSHASGTQDAFTEKTIALSDIRKGDFVVVDARREGKKLVADTVMVTLRGSGK
jgi:hypothetical protein